MQLLILKQLNYKYQLITFYHVQFIYKLKDARAKITYRALNYPSSTGLPIMH